MSDRIENFINSNAGKKVLGALGVNAPRELARYTPSQRSFFKGRLLLGAGDNAALLAQVSKILAESDAEVFGDDNARLQCTALTQDNGSDAPFAALVFDATGMRDSLELVAAYRFFNANIRKLAPGGRIVILGRPHMGADNAEQAATQRALEGLSRSLAKEVGARGSTAQLITVANGAEGDFGSSLRFVLSPKSAYVTGQVIAVNAVEQSGNVDWHKPLAGKTALVTGASRGIGEAIADTLARDGATVIGVDVAPMEDDLVKVMTRLGGQPLIADITAEDAPAKIASAAKQAGGIDLIVHNAGVTRDKTIANMTEQQWQMTLDINLAAAQRITRELLDQGLIRNGGSIVGVSSMNGIGGQRGQTNYAASKAGVIGYVDFMKNDEQLRAHNITVNAVAPGFIETAMTAAIPLFTRMFGRRLNSLSQGGLPVDVAEAIAFFANPLSRGVSGNTLRVCGQSWFGA
ncbi:MULTISPECIES: 3-oxoacyl-ACP reductase [unclassified Spongiibacter]|jgi:3-oxoacyl-[acyl-carrier protein] reductase|uniref:3-oxoacyl-ACP reductase n=1 Tax=Spongiibacter TaxID=630749 RepID=UPI000C0A2FB1|nr:MULTISPECIES: 3-oxoacyl-ACP reductase [unclassified Spongiibacter]MAK45585.1 3-oxoacyl-ACP reductase [Spongiibacter sp.]|tara:strand:- start:7014 stop:8399 length:1386 start_codon:yes stop_codon:yes gene_type:complete